MGGGGYIYIYIYIFPDPLQLLCTDMCISANNGAGPVASFAHIYYTDDVGLRTAKN